MNDPKPNPFDGTVEKNDPGLPDVPVDDYDDVPDDEGDKGEV